MGWEPSIPLAEACRKPTTGSAPTLLYPDLAVSGRMIRLRIGLIRLLAAAILPVLLLGAAAPTPHCSTVRSMPGQEAPALSSLRSMLETGKEKCIILSGRFSLATPLRITAAGSGMRLQSLPGAPAVLLAKTGAARGIEVINASDVIIQKIVLSGFARDGIFASDSRRLTVRSVMVKETMSDSWSQGGIHLTGNSTGARLVFNIVEDADYAGIILDSNPASDVSNVIIRNNSVVRSCRRVRDCGAIYINDRGRRSTNILIADNIVSNFGPRWVAGRAIYLDDWASHVIVRGNRISGPGRFAFQIHGGHDNCIIDNIVDMADIDTSLLYEPAINGVRSAMTGNVVAENILIHDEEKGAVAAQKERSGAGAVRLQRNGRCTHRE